MSDEEGACPRCDELTKQYYDLCVKYGRLEQSIIQVGAENSKLRRFHSNSSRVDLARRQLLDIRRKIDRAIARMHKVENVY